MKAEGLRLLLFSRAVRRRRGVHFCQSTQRAAKGEAYVGDGAEGG